MKLQNYMDMHTHILYGVDDGSKNIEETINMLKMVYEEGSSAIIATPHYTCGRQNATVETLRKRKDSVQREAEKFQKDFKIYLGNELYYSDGIVNDLKEGKALTMADSRYVLVEFNPATKYEKIRIAIHKLVLAGYIPIIAHVERYECLYKREELLAELIELGAYMQMNTGSLKGSIFNQRVSYNKKLVEYGFIHLFGSDCHNTTTRVPKMHSCLEGLKKVDCRTIERILFENPAKIIEDKYI